MYEILPQALTLPPPRTAVHQRRFGSFQLVGNLWGEISNHPPVSFFSASFSNWKERCGLTVTLSWISLTDQEKVFLWSRWFQLSGNLQFTASEEAWRPLGMWTGWSRIVSNRKRRAIGLDQSVAPEIHTRKFSVSCLTSQPLGQNKISK